MVFVWALDAVTTTKTTQKTLLLSFVFVGVFLKQEELDGVQCMNEGGIWNFCTRDALLRNGV